MRQGVLVDLRMPGMNGLDLQEALAKTVTSCRSSSSVATVIFRLP